MHIGSFSDWTRLHIEGIAGRSGDVHLSLVTRDDRGAIPPPYRSNARGSALDQLDMAPIER